MRNHDLVKPLLRVWEHLVSSKRGPSVAGETDKSDPTVNGFFRGREQLVSGWVLDLKDPQRKHDVEVFVGGKSIGKARGDRFDALVQSHHGGDGLYAFAIYHNADLSSGPVEAKVLDAATGAELRSKQPYVTRSSRTGSPLEIRKLTIGKTIELLGRVGAYPWGDELSLEIWVGTTRVVSSIPVVGSQSEGLFTAQLSSEALGHLITNDVEIALPGLKEAGLAVPFHKVQLAAAVSQQEGHLRVELRGTFEQTGPIPLTVRLKKDTAVVEEQISVVAGTAKLKIPRDFELDDNSLELFIFDVSVPVRMEWPLLEDAQFRTIGQESSPWSVSDNADAEPGFFAFPAPLADEHELSGYITHLTRRKPTDPLLLSQRTSSSPGRKNASVVGFARAPKKARITVRLRDEQGVVLETATTSRSGGAWNLFMLDLHGQREIVGELFFEVEASGPGVTNVDVALGHSRRAEAPNPVHLGANLLANDGMQHWPYGAGILEHSVEGSVAAGWKITNRGTPATFYTRALMHPTDNAIGLGIAAPEVSRHLRADIDFAVDEVAARPLVVRFRAGVPLSVKQMLSRQVDATPQFAIIDRIAVVRRVRITTRDSFEEREEVAAVFARKIPISSEIERFEFEVPAIEEPDSPSPVDSTSFEERYLLAFDFRHPTTIALFDIEVFARESIEETLSPPALRVEDRNIQLQIETLRSVAHWSGPTPVKVLDSSRANDPEPLKWEVGPSREPVTVVIPVFNALTETLACLDSLSRSSSVPILVRLIDDGSDEPVRHALENYARDKPWVHVHALERNRGYTYAADYGIRSARTDWVVLLNSDTVVTRGWLEGMLSCAHSNPGIAFVGPLSNAASYQSIPELYDASRKWKANRLPPGVSPEDMAGIVRKVSSKDYPVVPLLNGFCTMMKRSVFIQLGGLNPAAFPAGYGEENDLCLRALKAGVKLAVADDVYVYHVKSASFGSVRREELTKNGNAALRKLHPEVDVSALTARFRDTPALVAVRQAVSAELAKVYGPAESNGFDKSALPDHQHVGETDRQKQFQKA